MGEATANLLDKDPVRRVREALLAAGVEDRIAELPETARSAADTAAVLGVEVGAIVRAQVYLVDEQPVLALVAGDHRCKADALPRALALDGRVRQTDAEEVRAATGFAPGGVAPVALALALPVVIDVSLKRFDVVYVPAGHPRCVLPTHVEELKRLTGGIVSYAVTEPE